jgi:hypothetical protein
LEVDHFSYILYHQVCIIPHRIAPLVTLTEISYFMDKVQLAGQNLGRVFNSRSGCMCARHLFCHEAKRAQVKVENSAQTTFRLFPDRFRASWLFSTYRTRTFSLNR